MNPTVRVQGVRAARRSCSKVLLQQDTCATRCLCNKVLALAWGSLQKYRLNVHLGRRLSPDVYRRKSCVETVLETVGTVVETVVETASNL